MVIEHFIDGSSQVHAAHGMLRCSTERVAVLTVYGVIGRVTNVESTDLRVWVESHAAASNATSFAVASFSRQSALYRSLLLSAEGAERQCCSARGLNYYSLKRLTLCQPTNKRKS